MDDILPGTIQGKVWGKTQRIFCANNVQIDRLHAKKGWQCSEHYHRAKANMFYVESGHIIIRTSKDGLTDETELQAGESTVVRPGNTHQFVALADSVVLEIYWTSLDSDDIVRFTQGGPHTQQAPLPMPKTGAASPTSRRRNTGTKASAPGAGRNERSAPPRS